MQQWPHYPWASLAGTRAEATDEEIAEAVDEEIITAAADFCCWVLAGQQQGAHCWLGGELEEHPKGYAQEGSKPWGHVSVFPVQER